MSCAAAGGRTPRYAPRVRRTACGVIGAANEPVVKPAGETDVGAAADGG